MLDQRKRILEASLLVIIEDQTLLRRHAYWKERVRQYPCDYSCDWGEDEGWSEGSWSVEAKENPDKAASVEGAQGKRNGSRCVFLVKKEDREDVFHWFRNVKYPLGYARSLRNKVKLVDKKFYGLKTHDCHVLLQRLLPVVIRGFLPHNVVKPLISLSYWFKKLCVRELKITDVQQMEVQIVVILCNLELIFPPHFFTSMVHLMVHLPEQVLLTGPVHNT